MNRQAQLSPNLSKRRGGASLDKRKARAGWWFIMPFLLVFLLVYLPIVIDSIWVSLCELKILQGGGFKTNFVGLENYREALFSDTNFVKTLTTGLKQLVLDIPAIVIFSLFMAVLLNQKMMGRAVFRAIFFVPVILSTGLLESLMSGSVSSEEGGIEDGSGENAAAGFVSTVDMRRLFATIQVGKELVNYVFYIVDQILTIISYSGVQMLIFLAGLQSISPSIYEAARIDGASAWETFWKITFPMISPMILVNGIYTIIDSFTRNNNEVMKYIAGIYDVDQSQATAQYWVYFLIVFAIVALFAGIVSAYVFYQRRD